jgi:hypothetical protein
MTAADVCKFPRSQARFLFQAQRVARTNHPTEAARKMTLYVSLERYPKKWRMAEIKQRLKLKRAKTA